MTVYKPWNSGLGDQIATISLVASRARFLGAGEVSLARREVGKLHDELYGVFAPTNITSVPGLGDVPLSGYDVWAAEPWPTVVRWTETAAHSYYAYQYDGQSSAAIKNPPASDIDAIEMRLLNEYSLPGVALTKSMSIAECVDVLAGAAFFVGCDSGFSHLSHCVGSPTFILEYKLPIVTTHRNKQYMACAGAIDFVSNKLKAWANYRRFIGPGL